MSNLTILYTILQTHIPIFNWAELQCTHFSPALCTTWSELSLPSALERGVAPLHIDKQVVGTHSRLYGEYVDPWSAVISMSSQRQCMH
jgi:hypothetical protein